jgi:endonuclease/exonuclease/phosphatase family metal-dependent hydrolase
MTHEEWIDHILYTCTPGAQPFVRDAAVMRTAKNGKDLLREYKQASDHYPVLAQIVL